MGGVCWFTHRRHACPELAVALSGVEGEAEGATSKPATHELGDRRKLVRGHSERSAAESRNLLKRLVIRKARINTQVLLFGRKVLAYALYV